MSYELAGTQQNRFPYGIADVDRRILETFNHASIVATCSANKYLESICDEQFWQRWSQIHIPLLTPYQPLFRTWKNFGENALKSILYVVRDATDDQYYTHPRNAQKRLLAAIEDANTRGDPLPLIHVLFLGQKIMIDDEEKFIIPESQILYRIGDSDLPNITRDITAYYPNSSHYPTADERMRLRTRDQTLRQSEHRSIPMQLVTVFEITEDNGESVTIYQLTSDRLDEIHQLMMENLGNSFYVSLPSDHPTETEYSKNYGSNVTCTITRTSDTGYANYTELYPTVFGFIIRPSGPQLYSLLSGSDMPRSKLTHVLILINGDIKQGRNIQNITNNYLAAEITLDKLVSLMTSREHGTRIVANIIRHDTVYQLSDIIALTERRH